MLCKVNSAALRAAVTDRRTVHEEPVSGQHPDEHQHDGEREGQQLGQSETPTAAKGNPGKEKKHNNNCLNHTEPFQSVHHSG